MYRYKKKKSEINHDESHLTLEFLNKLLYYNDFIFNLQINEQTT